MGECLDEERLEGRDGGADDGDVDFEAGPEGNVDSLD